MAAHLVVSRLSSISASSPSPSSSAATATGAGAAHIPDDRLIGMALKHIHQREWRQAIERLDEKIATLDQMNANHQQESGGALCLRGRCLWNSAIEDWQKASRLGNIEARAQLGALIRSLEHEKARPRLLSRLSDTENRLRHVPTEFVDLFHDLHEIKQRVPSSESAISQLRGAVDEANVLFQTLPSILSFEFLSNSKSSTISITATPTTTTASAALLQQQQQENKFIGTELLDSMRNQISAIEKQIELAQQRQHELQLAIQEATSSPPPPPPTTAGAGSSQQGIHKRSESSRLVSTSDEQNQRHQETNAIQWKCFETLNNELWRKKREYESVMRLVLRAKTSRHRIETDLIPQMQQHRKQLVDNLFHCAQATERINSITTTTTTVSSIQRHQDDNLASRMLSRKRLSEEQDQEQERQSEQCKKRKSGKMDE